MRSMKRYMILASVALLAACGSDDKDSTGPGSVGANGAFSVAVGGDAEGSLSGFAVHASVNQGESQGFVLALNDTTQESGGVTGSLILGKVNPAIPTPGSHPIASIDEATDNDLWMFGVITDEDGVDWICYSTGGSMSVSSASASRFRGSVSIQATCGQATSDVEAEVTFSGNYDSRSGTVSLPTALRAQR